jgi:hypothetical protein
LKFQILFTINLKLQISVVFCKVEIGLLKENTGPDLRGSDWGGCSGGLHNTEIEPTDFTETFAGL